MTEARASTAQQLTRLDVRRAAAVLAARCSGAASRFLKHGGGTTLPGLVALRIDPDIVRALASQLTAGSIVVTGTNGKTTTSRMLGNILRDAGLLPLRNEAGSNLMRGLASSLARKATLAGNIAPDRHRVGIFEVDEAAVPEVLSALHPMTLLLLDLFRDQLDRYGEVAIVAQLWTSAVSRLPGTVEVVANADDPLVADVAGAAHGSIVFFGLEESDRELQTQEHARDVKACPRCQGHIQYDRVFLGHLGHYACSQCSFRRPEPSICAERVRLHGVEGSAFRLVAPQGTVDVVLPLPGLYNVYNALAAAAAALTRGIELGAIASSLAEVTPAFGRMERIPIAGRSVYLALAKNPAGLNEVLRTLLASDGALHLMVMLNDNIADGRDVSWIWDADVEMLRDRLASVVFGGIRAEDMALRFKYAGLIGPVDGPKWEITHDTSDGVDRALAMIPPGGHLFVVPTYTALLDVYGVLSRRGHVRPFWQE